MLAADGFLKSGIKIIGGKTGQMKDSGRSRVYKLIPDDIETYIEPFIGSAAILVGKERHNKEIVGDINPYTINFFQQFKENPEKLFHMLQKHISLLEEKGKDYFIEQRTKPPLDNKLELAGWYYVINKCSFNSIVRFNSKGVCNSTYCGTTKSRGYYTEEHFWKVYNRIKDVEFHNCIYQDLLKFDSDKTLYVFDPPYFSVFCMYDKVKFTNEDHIILRDNLSKLKAKWLLTINDVPQIRELYKDYNLIEHEIHYSCSQTVSGRGKRPELIITNY